ncbi:hypothetical protein Cgig2_020006 [Carnegiea gigantea]|uniref:Uncharacterized protein n=1 Tax=Carnegiea gigantea TaxID=171969 RepID=A0A9Q1KCY1_9CARY|nr:hypothetical protein Cgig2_020006 [Carnegiea gigantea]
MDEKRRQNKSQLESVKGGSAFKEVGHINNQCEQINGQLASQREAQERAHAQLRELITGLSVQVMQFTNRANDNGTNRGGSVTSTYQKLYPRGNVAGSQSGSRSAVSSTGSVTSKPRKALQGMKSFQTMRNITGKVGSRPIHILVDSGGTHNFLDSTTAKKMRCALLRIPPLVVVVAGGA